MSVSVLIKPSSSACNMRCNYCFYRDEANNRATADSGFMSLDTADKIIARAAEFSNGVCSFMFQGGEPTLCGLDFYEGFIALEEKYKGRGLIFRHSIQTNGLLIDERWAEFFKKNNFLVGLSLDGDAGINDLNRVDASGKGSYNRAIKCASLLKRYGVDFNILSVITGKNARSAAKLYSAMKKNGFKYLQFIPCLEPLNCEEKSKFHLSTEDYKSFLVTTFNMWFNDLKNGEYISIRHIDNLIALVRGGAPEICSMNGRCSIQFVVEGDGTVYPCDFYALDEWRLGNVFTDSFEDMVNSEKAKSFISDSAKLSDECLQCKYYRLCRGGCRRERVFEPDGASKTRYCESFKGFFDECGKNIGLAARCFSE